MEWKSTAASQPVASMYFSPAGATEITVEKGAGVWDLGPERWFCWMGAKLSKQNPIFTPFAVYFMMSSLYTI